MNKYDEILQIFESQKKEISKLTDKVNELEETNAFLITILEKSKTLPPVYDPNALRKDRLAAIEIEHSLKSFQEKLINFDSTHCETTLNDSYDENLITFNNPNSLGWSTDSSSHQKICNLISKSDKILKPFQEIRNSSDNESKKNIDNHANFESNNLHLRISDTSPVRRRQTYPVINFISNSEKFINSDISKHFSNENNISNAKCVNEKGIAVTNIDEKFVSEPGRKEAIQKCSESVKLFSQITDPKSMSCKESSHTNTVVSESVKNVNVEHALDYLIETLQKSTIPSDVLEPNPCFSISQDKKPTVHPDLIYSEYMNDLLDFKDQYIFNAIDRHSQMKLLLTTQQMKTDIMHKSLEENNKLVFSSANHVLEDKVVQTIQNQSSEESIPPSIPSLSTAQQSISDASEVSESVLPSQMSNLKLFKERELARLNHEKMLECPRIRNGFVKFTALIKGHIVRTLYETDKVQNIIITIKDTAQLAIKLRQERLSGDSSQSDDCCTPRFFTRRNNQEIISFQQRLVSQIKAALCELHEIFFNWPPSLQMRLIRNHIIQITSSTTAKLQNNKESLDPGTSIDFNESRAKSSARLSSATLKRRQKLALRSNNIKENRTKNIHCASPRKPIHSATYGCRGYVVGTHSRTTNSQSKSAFDKKSRTNNATHRRSGVRTIVKSDVHQIPTNIKSNKGAFEFQRSEVLETVPSKTLSKKIFQFHQQQQQQSCTDAFEIRPQPVQQNSESKATSSVGRSQKSSRMSLDKNNLVYNIKSNGINNVFPSVANGGDSNEESFHSKIFSANPSSVQKIPHVDPDQGDWRSRTFKLCDENKSSIDINKTWSKKHKIRIGDIDDFNNNSSSRVEVDLNDVDIGYLCENNSHYNECNDSTESNTTVVVDLANDCKAVNVDSYHCRSPCVPSHKASSSKNIHNTRQPLFKPYLNNAALNYVKSEFDICTKNDIIPSLKSQFKIRKRIVACSSVYSSTVSHN